MRVPVYFAIIDFFSLLQAFHPVFACFLLGWQFAGYPLVSNISDQI
jgi:hypothetical protein